MANPHYVMRHAVDPHPVRPGTSDALFARTIDATIHPPLVRAQETVAALIPRVAVPLASPVLLSMLGVTLVMFWVASRMKFRPSALVLSGLLVMTLTSFHPLRASSETRIADDTVRDVRRVDKWTPRDLYQMPEPVALPDVPDVPDVAMPSDYPTQPVEPTVDFPGIELPVLTPDET